MSAGVVHSGACRIGTSHRVPDECRGADYKLIPYPVEAPEPDPGPTDPGTNSEEGQTALSASATPSDDVRAALEAHLARISAATPSETPSTPPVAPSAPRRPSRGPKPTPEQLEEWRDRDERAAARAALNPDPDGHGDARGLEGAQE